MFLILIAILVAITTIAFVSFLYKKRYNDLNPSKLPKNIKLSQNNQTHESKDGSGAAKDLDLKAYENFTTDHKNSDDSA